MYYNWHNNIASLIYKQPRTFLPCEILQSRQTQCQRCKQRVQQSNNTEKHNIQHQLDGHNQQRQSRGQGVQEDQQPSKSQDGNRSGNGGEDLDDDESKKCADGDELALLLGLRCNVGVLRVEIDVNVGRGCCLVGFRKRFDVIGGRSYSSRDEVKLSTDLGGGSGLLDERGRCGERGKSSV
jgi:hypothetical protein